MREEIVNYGQGKKKRKENQEKKIKWVERGQQDRRQWKEIRIHLMTWNRREKKTVVQMYCLLFLNTKRNWIAALGASCMPWWLHIYLDLESDLSNPKETRNSPNKGILEKKGERGFWFIVAIIQESRKVFSQKEEEKKRRLSVIKCYLLFWLLPAIELKAESNG